MVSSETLRRHGLRSTPQRRAILGAFEGGVAEHLSADEVHARAQQTHPELSRATVYATLAEFTELGVLGAIGAPEPVRYETNAEPHDHFRCRVCLRHFDLDLPPRDAAGLAPRGFSVERVETRLEGVCADCAQYERGLVAGVRSMREPTRRATCSIGPASRTRSVESPLGPLQLAAGPNGLARLAFEDHGDFERDARARAGAAAAATPPASTSASRPQSWSATSPGTWSGSPCRSTGRRWARRSRRCCARRPRSRTAAAGPTATSGCSVPPRDMARGYGANPVPVVVACHRVMLGAESPDAFVGGVERRRWLEAHERRRA